MSATIPGYCGGVRLERGKHHDLRLLASTCRQYLFDPTWRVILGCFAVLSTMLTMLFALIGISEPLGIVAEPGTDVLLTALLGWTTFLAGSAIAASLVAGNEWNSGRYIVSFALVPQRRKVVVAHIGGASFCSFLMALPLAMAQLALVHVLTANVNGDGPVAPGLLAGSSELVAVVLLAALGSACAAAMGAGMGMLLRSRIGGTLVMAAVFFVVPAVVAAAGLMPELLPVAHWSALATVPLSEGLARLGTVVPAAIAWPVGVGLAAVWRTKKYDLDS